MQLLVFINLYVKTKKKNKRRKNYFIYSYYIYVRKSLPYAGDSCFWKGASSSPWIPVTHHLERDFQEGPCRNIHHLLGSGPPCRICLQVNRWLHHDFWCVENSNPSRQTPFKFLEGLRQVIYPKICSVPFLIVRYFDCTCLLNRALFHILGLLDYW